MGGFQLSDLSEAPQPDGPPTSGYFFAVFLPGGRIGHAGVIAEAYLDEPDDKLWRECVLGELNELEDSGWTLDDVGDLLVETGILVVERTDDPPERGPFPRPLTEVEKAVALRVLEMDRVAELDILSEQLEAAVATAPCECPCPTITIEVDRARAKPIERRGHFDATASWDRGGISVESCDGWLNNLEIWWYIGDAPLAFPPLTRIRPSEGYRGSAASGPSERFRGTLR